MGATKQPGGVEDLLIGLPADNQTQTRGGNAVNITAINSGNIPHSDSQSIGDVLDSIDGSEAGRLSLLEGINDDRNEPSGFIRGTKTTIGVIELSPDGTIVHRCMPDGTYSTNSTGLFYDGTAAFERGFCISPLSVADGGDDTYSIYIDGVKYINTTCNTITFPDQTGLQFVYHEDEGTLATDTVFAFDYFHEKPIVATVYGNSPHAELVLFGDERHGIDMSGASHEYHHFSDSTQYNSGMDIQGLVAGVTTMTQVASGVARDEDIKMSPLAQTLLPHWHYEWDVTAAANGWRVSSANNEVALLTVGGASQYNQDVGGEYTLTEVTTNDTMIVFVALTNDIINPYVKILGQEVYNNTNEARAAIGTALSNLVLTGLPSPEFLPIGAVIVNAAGEVQTLSDGSLYFDLRNTTLAGAGSPSAAATYHPDLLGRDEDDSHPMSAITGLSDALGVETNASYGLLNPSSIAINGLVETKNFAAKPYTGNGGSNIIITAISSGDLVAGITDTEGRLIVHDRTSGDCIINIDGTPTESGSAVLNISDVHLKSRSLGTAGYNNYRLDGVRGAGKQVLTDDTVVELFNIEILSSFNVDGFTLGSSIGSNGDLENLKLYISYQTLYTHIVWGLTNHGKRYIVAYNPVTRQMLPMWIGSGLAGHQIPNPLGVELDYLEHKNLEDTSSWLVRTSMMANDEWLKLNDINAISTSADVWDNKPMTADYFPVASASGWGSNDLDETVIGYGKAKSETWTIDSDGTQIIMTDLALDGTVVRRIQKNTSTTGDWNATDYQRGETLAIELNTSDIEKTVTASGDTYATDDSYFDKVTDGSFLNKTASIDAYTFGLGEGGYNRTTKISTKTIDYIGVSDGIKYTAEMEADTTFDFSDVGGERHTNSLLNVSFPEIVGTTPNGNNIWFSTELGKHFMSSSTIIDDGSLNVSTTDATSTHNTYVGTNGTVSASSETGGQFAWETFSDGTSSFWWLASTGTGEWIQYLFNTAIIINKYTLSCSSNTANMSKNWAIEASSTGAFSGEEVTLDTVTNETAWSDTEVRTFTFINSTSYTYYRVVVSAVNGGANTVIRAIEFIEAELIVNDTETPAISFIKTAIMVASETPVDFRYDEPEIPDNVSGSHEFTGVVNLGKNRYLIDAGTIFNNSRYVYDFPTNDGTYIDWDVKVELFGNGVWSETRWIFTTGGYGAYSSANEEGMIIQTGKLGLRADYSYNSGDGFNINSVSEAWSSAPARIIATYMGKTNA